MLEPVIAVNSIKKNIKLQLFQIDNKDKSKHSKNSVKQQIQTNIHERMSKKIECQSSFECLCQEGSKHSSRSRVAVASRMRQACSSRLHARNCFQIKASLTAVF